MIYFAHVESNDMSGRSSVHAMCTAVSNVLKKKAIKLVEAGGVELQKSIENTQLIENSKRTTRKKRGKSGSDVHGMYTKFGRTSCFVSLRNAGGISLQISLSLLPKER
jgi:hypothetical protein